MAAWQTRLEPLLTLENARKWRDAQEKYLFVTYDILDEVEVNNTDATVDYVEGRLERLLIEAGEIA